MNPPHRRALRVAIGLAMVLLQGCDSEPPEIPAPDLKGTEPAIAAAIADVQQRVREQPGSAPAWGALADRYYVHGWLAMAARCYARAESLDPAEFSWPYRLGLSSIRGEDPEAGTVAFERAVAIDTEYAPAHLILAETLVQLGRFGDAERHFETARRLDPTSSYAELGLGQLALSAGEIDIAASYLERALAIDPRHGAVHSALARVRLTLGDPERAAHHVARARELPALTRRSDPRAVPDLEPVGSKALTDRGLTLESRGELDRAAEHYLEAIRIRPEQRQAHYRLGGILLSQGKREEAAEHWIEAARLKSTDPELLDALSVTLLELRRGAEAETYLRQSLELRPDNPVSHYNFGTLLLQQRDFEAAIAHLGKAVSLRPVYADAVANLGIAFLHQGDFATAEKHLRNALRQAPDHGAARRNLDRLLTARGQR